MLAGQAENALLAKYEGNWRGSGKVTGPDPGTVACRLSMKNSSPGTLTYTGRCSFSGGGASFRGAMTYNDATKRFEAASSTQGASSTAIGKRQGGGIVFSAGDMDTRYGTATTTLALADDIRLSFKLVDKDGRTTSSNVTFARR